MNQKSFPKLLMALVRALIGGIVGAAIGSMLFETVLPVWKVSSIGLAPKGTVDILFVDYRYLGTWKLDQNTIYLKSQSQVIYFGHQKNWEVLPPLPDGHHVSEIWWQDKNTQKPIVAVADQGEVYQMINGRWELLENHSGQFGGFTPSTCANVWFFPAFGTVDSAGVVFAHALANEHICYVLSNDGRIQVWTRTADVFTLLGILTTGALIGIVIGSKAESITNFFKRNMQRKTSIT